MKRKRNMLKAKPTLRYEDARGNLVAVDFAMPYPLPQEVYVQISQFPNVLRETYREITKQKDVDACDHPSRYVVETFGWIDGIEGRKCLLCNGRQTKEVLGSWPDKWDGTGSRELFTSESSWPEDLVLSMVNKAGYNLSDAIIIAANLCERCMNVMAWNMGLRWGYSPISLEYKKANTSCSYCQKVLYERPRTIWRLIVWMFT